MFLNLKDDKLFSSHSRVRGIRDIRDAEDCSLHGRQSLVISGYFNVDLHLLARVT
jgi:hypothetical protein